MRFQALALFPFLAVASAVRPTSVWATSAQAESQRLTASGLPQFLVAFEKSLTPVDSAFDDLENAKLPLFDESGRAVGRRNIQDRRKTLSDLRDTVKQLEASPQDLVLTMMLFDSSERLADDLYDLSQIAFDNDQEELGTRLSDLLTSLDRNQDLIESYATSLAAEKEQRLRALEKENQDLQQRLKESQASKAKPAAQQ